MAATAKVISYNQEHFSNSPFIKDHCKEHFKFQPSAEIESAMSNLVVTNDQLKEVMQLLQENMILGLSEETQSQSNLKMFPTYVRSVPDGSEEGSYLALDLGGTNFRVLLINLAKQEATMKSKIYLVPQSVMVGTGVQLFDHIVDCIVKFAQHLGIEDKYLPMGFTFSFPCKQIGLDKAILTVWTKGFNCSGVEGQDIVHLLHEAINRRPEINIKCLAVINDTVGALMSCAHSDPECGIGIILGTGTNTCYFEKLENVQTWDGDKDEPKQVIINTEWGAFGDNGCLEFIRTEFDSDVDRTSINPNKQLFEKMISGMYMGELVRLALIRLIDLGLLLTGKNSEGLRKQGEFYTKYVSEIESDVSDFQHTEQILEELDITSYTIEDCRIIKYVCSLISRRAAFLASAGLAAIVNHMDRPKVTIAVDGSLYRFHPNFHELMTLKMQELVNPNLQFKLMLSFDGSGKGAAIVASVAHRLKERNEQMTGHVE